MEPPCDEGLRAAGGQAARVGRCAALVPLYAGQYEWAGCLRTRVHECGAEEDGEADCPCGPRHEWPACCVDGGLANTLRLRGWVLNSQLQPYLEDGTSYRPAWPARRDSNPRHLVPKTSALSTELRAVDSGPIWGERRDLNPRSPGPQPGVLTPRLRPPRFTILRVSRAGVQRGMPGRVPCAHGATVVQLPLLHSPCAAHPPGLAGGLSAWST